jgi:Methyltransferase domain
MTAIAALPDSLDELLSNCISRSQSRLEFWVELLRSIHAERIAEVGVYRGDFSAFVLHRCALLSKYYMIDPWRHLDDWNKPANHDDALLERFFQETKLKTDFAAAKRVVLRGKTTEVIDQIRDGDLDLAYIDADHTLKGIAVDLIRVYPKVRVGGFLGGDDFTPSIWEHKTTFEPTLVFPFAIYFAEAVGARIYALPYWQFILQKTERSHFAFVDLTGQYNETGLRNQLNPEKIVKIMLGQRFPRLKRVVTRAKNLWAS